MTALRRLCSHSPALVALMLAAALVMKLLVPNGYMADTSGASGMTITVSICSGTGPQTTAITIPMDEQHDDADRAVDAMPCAFAGVPGAMLAAVDPVLLVGAIVFVLASGLVRQQFVLPRAVRTLRPPLRGPPTTA
ncbi:DUF2946 family protein [Sphingomonas baiyangensis]|uniref:DUF2946 domain-containing protein n=1 Tax=Sphingomonas baiyangensis TaxID=2572576 RepID=A0A4U1L3M2_9SPHN|nr:DUF2946 family protein [Sphingomonas baiyangensis]TKD51501.1 hypothetical protein FBR43_12615 [Sphingomonas baiyangensis]